MTYLLTDDLKTAYRRSDLSLAAMLVFNTAVFFVLNWLFTEVEPTSRWISVIFAIALGVHAAEISWVPIAFLRERKNRKKFIEEMTAIEDEIETIRKSYTKARASLDKFQDSNNNTPTNVGDASRRLQDGC
jgi:hypothetical protein